MRYLFLLLFSFGSFGIELKHPWVIYYGDSAPLEAFDPYDPIILQSEFAFAADLAQNKTVLGYLNLGEAETENPEFLEMQEKGLLIEENPDWPGSWKIDLRHSFWQSNILEKKIPALLQAGFNGLFLDQLDVVLDLEEKNPEKFKGMKEAAIWLVKEIRKQFPEIKLMMNRGYEILPQVGRDIDYELAETLYTSYNFKTKRYYVRSKQEFEWQLAKLNAARKTFPNLVYFSLDYWNSNDKKMLEKIYSVELTHSFRPYVSIISLDKIVPAP